MPYQERSSCWWASVGPSPHTMTPFIGCSFKDAILLKRRLDELNHGTWASAATCAISRASLSEEASGLSIKTGLPHLTASFICVRCERASTLSSKMPSTDPHISEI